MYDGTIACYTAIPKIVLYAGWVAVTASAVAIREDFTCSRSCWKGGP